MSSAQHVTPKKHYQAPALKVYGSIEALTASVANTATMDGGGGAMSKTH